MRKELLSSHFTNGETVAQEHLNKLPMSHSSQMERQNLNLDSWVPKLGFNPDNQWPEHGGLPSQAASCLRLEAPFFIEPTCCCLQWHSKLLTSRRQ